MGGQSIVAWVEDHVIGYFANRFHYPSTVFKWDTDVRKAFNFDPTSWVELADQFNRQDWMAQIHVLLAQQEMTKLKTIGDVTSLICDKYRKERAFAANLPKQSALKKLTRSSGKRKSK